MTTRRIFEPWIVARAACSEFERARALEFSDDLASRQQLERWRSCGDDFIQTAPDMGPSIFKSKVLQKLRARTKDASDDRLVGEREDRRKS